MIYLPLKTNRYCRKMTEQPVKKQWSKQVWSTLLFAVAMVWTGSATGAENQYSLPGNQWYVRLTVSTNDGRRDDGNTLGRLLDSNQGKDGHDLAEMDPPPPPMGDNYLSIIFPHPEWGGDMQNYASDYHDVPADPGKGDVWSFAVRTHTPGIQAELSWQGPPAILGRSRLKEAQSGRIVVENCAAVTRYTITLDKNGNSFVWEYLGQNKKTAPSAASQGKPGSG